MQDYIDEQMKRLAMNIDDFHIGQQVIDEDKNICEITDKSLNSIEVFMKKTNENGANCKQWFEMRVFNKIFKPLNK